MALVLQAFLEEPFEPSDVCGMKFATWKTIFLVALASARHVSCLHALSLEPDPQQPDMPGLLRFGRHKADVTIFSNSAFVAKNQRLDSNPPVVIKSHTHLLQANRNQTISCVLYVLVVLFEMHAV